MKKSILITICLSLFLTACGAADPGGSVSVAVQDKYRNYYEVFVYSFADSNGDGIGDLAGVTQKLDHIENLGCNGIWLMPIQPSPTYHKYDITDYENIDPAYGTLADFDDLLAAAHARQISVIIDLVINHTSVEHPWFLAAKAYLQDLPASKSPDPAECPYVDYYHFSTERKDATWYPLAGTEYYYEGGFWERMPDLNLSSEAVLTELIQVADFWQEHGVDGFRMDALMHYSENDTEQNVDVLCKLYDHCREKDPDFYIVSEVWASEQTILEYYVNGAPSLFDFPMAGAEGTLLKAAKGKMSGAQFVQALLDAEDKRYAANPDAVNAPFLTNHDMGRVANALNSNAEDMKMASALLLGMNGNPFLYYGEELGMVSKGTKDENKRLPMPWTKDGLGNRLQGTSGDGAIKAGSFVCYGPEDADAVLQTCEPADKQVKDKDSLYQFYRKSLSLRNRVPQIARGRSAAVPGVPEAIYRDWQGSGVFIVFNTGEDQLQYALSDLATSGGLSILETVSVSGRNAKIKGDTLTVPPRSVVYLQEVR
ncbi:MAG: alpha amylase [Lachnospiraceae bacterium]|nr:alpha amylase [Lachnospiraceae bacterium]